MKFKYAKEFEAAVNQIDKNLLANKQLRVWVGTSLKCEALKIYKESWANSSGDPVTSPTRIFFSIWVDPAKENKLFYNIHALKLPQLKGYKIESRKFAEAFRKDFKGFANNWDNLNLKLGPLTLMEGFVNLEPKSFQDDVLRLSNQFLDIEHLVDQNLSRFKM